MELPIPGTLLYTPELHALLLGIEDELGLPSQILGPNLRIRWNHNETELLQLQLRPRNDNGTPQWEITPSIEDREKLLYDEYLDIEYAGDPDIRSDIPYAWNLGLNPNNWIQGLMSPIFTWENLCYYVGNTLAELPMTLAALPPPSWLDSKAIIHDPRMECFTAVASRDGLHVTLLRVSGDHRGTHQFAIPAHAAHDAGKPLIESYAANFGPGFPLSQTGIKMDIPGVKTLSDFYGEDYDIDDEGDGGRDAHGPNYHDHIALLRELSEWHHGPIPGEIMAEDTMEFPEWK